MPQNACERELSESRGSNWMVKPRFMKSHADGESRVQQMIMGAGKTTVAWSI